MRIRALLAVLTVGALTLTACGTENYHAGAGNAADRPAPGVLQVNNRANSAEALDDIEAIKQLKARYCRFLDTKQWSAWREVFTDDFVSDTSESGGKVIEGADEFVAFVRQMIGQPTQTTVHQVIMPEIEVTSADAAKAIWAMEDTVDFTPVLGLHGHGHYHETYVKIDGQWRIKSSKLTRLRQHLETPVAALPLPDLKKAVDEALGRR